MPVRFKTSDSALLFSVADCGVLTTTQITTLHFGCKKVARRRLAQLAEDGLVVEKQGQLGRSQGRPERTWSLGEEGFRLLRDRGQILPGVSFEQMADRSVHCLDHAILLNWFSIHLRQIGAIIPRLSVDFHVSGSPFVPRNESGTSLLHIHVPADEVSPENSFLIPDAVFRVTDMEQGKSVLFFLEVDMGTETLASPKRDGKDVRQKILNYKALFRSGKYKLFEGLWGCRFTGFRLLLLANTAERMSFLCRLAQEMPPSDFVWVTDQERMFGKGLADTIWSRGGNSANPPQSILGPTLACPSPLPALL